MKLEIKRAFEDLKKAMGELDNSIPDYVFDDDDGPSLAEKINKVWDKIEVARHEVMKWK